MRSHPSAVSTCMLLQPGPHGPNHDCHPILRPLHHRRLRHLSAPGSTGFASPPRRQTPRRPRSCAVRSSKYLPIRKKPTRRTWTNGSVMGGGRVKVIAALPASRDHRRDRAGRGIEEPPIGRLLISLGGCALTRTKFLEHFANLAPCLVAMEACGGTQHWARRLRELGHEVRLLPAKVVRPFVGGNKSDAHDARAIWTAVQQPCVKTADIKTEEQQAILALHRMRQQLVKFRTAPINCLRGLLTEYGEVMPKGRAGMRRGMAEAERSRCSSGRRRPASAATRRATSSNWRSSPGRARLKSCRARAAPSGA